MKKPVIPVLILLSIQLLFACSPRHVLPPADPISRLGDKIDLTLADPTFYMANWGIYIESLQTGETVYSHNPHKLFMPASNMKLFTTAAALEFLGPDYRYRTKLLGKGEISENGVFSGDLLIKGSGDPSFGEFNSAGACGDLNVWIQKIKNLGITEMQGSLICDDTCFDQEYYGGGWEYDDLTSRYAAAVSGISINGNVVRITVKPASKPGFPPDISVLPENNGYISIVNNAETVDADKLENIAVDTNVESNKITVSGTIPVDSDQYSRQIAVYNPSEYAGNILKVLLEETGITCHLNIYNYRDISNSKLDISDGWEVYAETVSAPVSELIRETNKQSNNLYAEHLLKTLDKENEGIGSFRGGRNMLERLVTRTGSNPEQFRAFDGSGLSRHNLVTPVHIGNLLRYMKLSPNYEKYYESLPSAGHDGTISSRMKATAAERNVHAKTGTIRYVKALSGYVKSSDGEDFAVAILVNHYTTPSSTANLLQDRIFVILSNFSRSR